MDVLLTVLIWLSGVVVPLVLGVVFSDPLQRLAEYVVARLVSPRKLRGIDGRWIATFEVGPKTYTEVIRLRTRVRLTTGALPEDPVNRARRPTLAAGTFRLRGDYAAQRYFSGLWFHPEHANHLFGAFHLILDPSGKRMKGLWIGHNPASDEVVCGPWTWRRLEAPPEALPDEQSACAH